MRIKSERIIAVSILAVAVATASMFFLPNPAIDVQSTFIIAAGQTLSEVASSLDRQNLIHSRYFFMVYAILIGQEKSFKAGRYSIPARASIHTLVRMFSRGEAKPDDIIVTIPEGTNVADIGRIFESTGLVKLSDFLNHSVIAKEGYLFPDTYRFARSFEISELTQNKPLQEILDKMESNFTVRTTDLFKGMTQSKQQEIIITASILEKEVRTANDMRLVAGIIEKRQDLGMALEIDATVAYGVCRPKLVQGKYCDVSQVNLVDNIPIDSVYNTYRRKGLPVSPISNPGLQAIQAALNPQTSEYLYYLNAKDGTTIFSRTGAEHTEARKKYLGL